MVFLDRYGFPIERIKGRPITNLIRTILWVRKIRRGYWDGFRVVRGKRPDHIPSDTPISYDSEAVAEAMKKDA